MDVNRGGQAGIQQLLAAEQDAQSIVNSARTTKLARLKQAKDEADQEISDYRSKMEQDFQRKVSQDTGDSGTVAKRLESETEEKIRNLKSTASSVSSQVIDMLLKHVTTVNN